MSLLRSSSVTSEDIDRIVTICNQLVNNLVITSENIDVSTFDDGFVSSIFLVKFKNLNKSSSSSLVLLPPPSIVIKFFPEPSDDSPFNALIGQLNAIAISKASLGPNILLCGERVLVMEHIDGVRAATREDDLDKRFRCEIAKRLARLHTLQVPISRNDYRTKITGILVDWPLKGANGSDSSLANAFQTGPLREILDENNCKNLLHHNTTIEQEVTFYYDVVMKADAEGRLPITFTHRDFNHNNILVSDSAKNSVVDTNNQRWITFIDFDFSSYFYRGADIGRYLADCQQTDQFTGDDLVPDSIWHEFITTYREESIRLLGSEWAEDKKNSVEHLMIEAKLMALLAYWIDTIFCIWIAKMEIDQLTQTTDKQVNGENDENANNKNSENNKSIKADIKCTAGWAKATEFMIKADRRFGGYLNAKARFQKDGVL